MAPSPYIELHAHSAFSFLDGASTPLELAGSAARHGYEAMALTDHDGVWGSMEFAVSCAGLGIRAISGAELSVSIGRPEPAHVTLLVEDAEGWRNLCRLLTLAHSHTRRGKARELGRPWVTIEQLEAHASGLVCLTGCATDGLLAGAFTGRPAHSSAVEAARRLVEERGRAGDYASVADLASRSGVDREGLERLAWAGALDDLMPATAGGKKDDRRSAYWQLGVVGARPPAPAVQMSIPLESPPTPETIEQLDSWQTMIADYQSTGISLGAHPMSLLRGSLGAEVKRSAQLPSHRDGAIVEVAGMVTARQRPETARGVTFITLEDETGTANLIVGRRVYENARMAVRSAPLLWAKGRLEHREGPVNSSSPSSARCNL
jgi:DNA polymerase III alpha subunit